MSIVTAEQIFLKAEEFYAKGENPTIEKIRVALGSKGSYSTIAKYLKEWRLNLTTAPTIPSALPQRVNAVVDAVWQELDAQAQAKIETIQQESTSQIHALQTVLQQEQTEKKELIAQVELLTLERRELLAKQFSLEQKVQQQEIAYQKVETQFNELRQQYEIEKAHYEARLQEIKSLQQQEITTLKAQITQYESVANDLKSYHENYRQQAEVKILNLQEVQHQSDVRYAQTQKEVESLQAELKRVTQSNHYQQSIQTELATLKTQLEALQQQEETHQQHTTKAYVHIQQQFSSQAVSFQDAFQQQLQTLEEHVNALQTNLQKSILQLGERIPNNIEKRE